LSLSGGDLKELVNSMLQDDVFKSCSEDFKDDLMLVMYRDGIFLLHFFGLALLGKYLSVQDFCMREINNVHRVSETLLKRLVQKLTLQERGLES
jgi:hypothetical protein